MTNEAWIRVDGIPYLRADLVTDLVDGWERLGQIHPEDIARTDAEIAKMEAVVNRVRDAFAKP